MAMVDDTGVVEMAWDPITRIVGSLGIYTKIDFKAKQVIECHSTSSIFRGYSIFMKGKDPRDAHFITSRICGICGDSHATCSVYNQNMAYGVRPPHLGEWIINLGQSEPARGRVLPRGAPGKPVDHFVTPGVMSYGQLLTNDLVEINLGIRILL